MDNVVLGRHESPMWNERYANRFEAYGDAPNDFLRAVARTIPDGPVLEIAAGEGRNAIFLASLGYEVTAMDQSEVGLANAKDLAERHGLPLRTCVADLSDFDFGAGEWAGIVGIWSHLPPGLRAQVHASCVRGLRPGGAMILELYSPAQLDMPGIGGPPDIAFLLDPAAARSELAGLDFELLQEARRDVDEGRFHQGPSATTQVLARRPITQP